MLNVLSRRTRARPQRRAGACDGPRTTPLDCRRWRRRPLVAALVRVLVFAVPIAVAFVTTSALVAALPEPPTLGARCAWWMLVAALVVTSVVVVDPLCRRLLPLATLYSVSLAFPDRAPTRFHVLRSRGRLRDLRHRVDEIQSRGLDDCELHTSLTVLTLACTLASHDSRTRGHSERVRVLTDMLAEELGLDQHDRDRLLWAALLHDIGKVTIAAPILNKSGRPTAAEWLLLKAHPEVGGRLIEPIREWLGPWALAVDEHHEAFDGSGYPRGLAGREISYAARIVAVADAFEAMTASRPYQRRRPSAAARDVIVRLAGTQFDPEVVRALVTLSSGRLWRRVGLVSLVGDIPLLGRMQALLTGGGRVAAAGGLAAGAAAVALQASYSTAIATAPIRYTPIQGAVAVLAVPSSPDPAGDGTRFGVEALTGGSATAVPQREAVGQVSPGTSDAAAASTTAPAAAPGAPPADATPDTTAPADPTPHVGDGAPPPSAPPPAAGSPATDGPQTMPPASTSPTAPAPPPSDQPPLRTPSLSLPGQSHGAAGTTYATSGTLDQAGASGWTGSVDYGDGTPAQPVWPSQDGTVSLTHVYDAKGKYTVQVRLVDGAGHSVIGTTIAHIHP